MSLSPDVPAVLNEECCEQEDVIFNVRFAKPRVHQVKCPVLKVNDNRPQQLKCLKLLWPECGI